MASAATAIAVFSNPQVRGTIVLKQKGTGIQIKAVFQRLPPGKHGLHIHKGGDLSQPGCAGACDHWHKGPPSSHGGQPGETPQRHTGDLGNISQGQRKTIFLEHVGLGELYGRSIIVHADEDDLGHGLYEDSKTTGHSGARIGCAIIGRVNPTSFKGTRQKTRKSHGGWFAPSIMGPFTQNAAMLTPLVVAAGYRLINNAKTRRNKCQPKMRSEKV
jgi:Cu-Zn family superoxide dismutase